MWLQAQFRFLGRENPEHIAEAQAASLGFIKGHTVEEIKQAGEEIYEESIAPRIWPGTRAIAQMHLDAGHQVWLVTAAPAEMAGMIAARLGMTGALGTQADAEDGVYTGRLDGGLLHGPAKADGGPRSGRAARLRPRALLRLLRLAQRPAAPLPGRPSVRDQPRRQAAGHAEEQDWQIRDYRTGRRAMKVGALGAGTLGATAGAVLAGLAIRRHLKG